MKSSTEEALAQCLEAIENGLPVEDCLEEFPQLRGELLDMLDMVHAIQTEAVRVAPRAEFRRSAQSRLLVRLTERRVTLWQRLGLAAPAVQPAGRRRFSFAWAFVLVFAILFSAGSGVVYASGNALPGDALYGVKGIVEQTLLLISSDQADLNLRMQFTERRMQEIETLTDLNRVGDLETAVDGYVQEVDAITTIMENTEIAAVQAEELTTLNRGQFNRLEVLMQKAPVQAQKHLQVAMEASGRISPGKSGNIGKPEETGPPSHVVTGRITRRPRSTNTNAHHMMDTSPSASGENPPATEEYKNTGQAQKATVQAERTETPRKTPLPKEVDSDSQAIETQDPPLSTTPVPPPGKEETKDKVK